MLPAVTARLVVSIGDENAGCAPALLKRGNAPCQSGVVSNTLKPSKIGLRASPRMLARRLGFCQQGPRETISLGERVAPILRLIWRTGPTRRDCGHRADKAANQGRRPVIQF